MRKRGITVFALSMMLALGTASLTAYAEGWQQSGTDWVYYDSNNYKVTNEWKKGADGLWRYLNSQGLMAVNSWVDDEYYVDNNGIMVTNKWLKLQKKNPGWDEENTIVWYYFANSGKVVTDGWSKIDNKYYYFDSDGAMQTGWVDDDTYYTGSDGAMRTGWQYLEDPEEDDSFDDKTVPFGDDEDKHWYYFQSSGKKYVPNISSGDYKLYKIDGAYYCFSETGAMQTGWVNMGDKSDDSFENYRYFQDNGKVQTGWYSTTPPEDTELNMDLGNEVEWYYFSSNGTPKVGPSAEEASTSDLVRINGITYLFNEKGNPVYGLRRLRVGSTDEYACYYFGNKATSSVVKGKGTVEEGDGTRSEFYFSESGTKAGRGYTGVKENYLFYMGKLQKAESGTKYEAIRIDNKVYLVSTSGKVVKSTTVKDSSGTKYKTNSSGQIIQVDEQSDDGKSLAREPIEPEYWED